MAGQRDKSRRSAYGQHASWPGLRCGSLALSVAIDDQKHPAMAAAYSAGAPAAISSSTRDHGTIPDA